MPPSSGRGSFALTATVSRGYGRLTLNFTLTVSSGARGFDALDSVHRLRDDSAAQEVPLYPALDSGRICFMFPSLGHGGSCRLTHCQKLNSIGNSSCLRDN